MSGSTMVAATAQLVELLKRHPKAPTDAVFYEPQAPEKMGRASIAVVDWLPAAVNDAALKSGRRRREERYTIQLECTAVAPGEGQRAADEAALALLRVVDETVADFPTLSGADLDSGQQIVSALVENWTLDVRGPMDRAGHLCRFTVDVAVHARLL